jgi:toxin ParE1/3/4
LAYCLKFSHQALQQVGRARQWYEAQQVALGEEFLAALGLQFKRLEQAPLLYQEVLPRIRRAVVPKFPYLVFYTVEGDVIHVLSVWHQRANPKRWNP